MSAVFIIEHLEKEIFPWCLIEYKHISSIAGKECLWFTNLRGVRGAEKLQRYGRCFSAPARKLKLANECVLDPAAKKTLTPQEAKTFHYFIFGGILGDYPPQQRTKKELTPFLKDVTVRNIGKQQLATDNAAAVVREITLGAKLSALSFQDNIEIRINEIESVQLPYRYLLVKGKPFVSPALVRYLKKKKEF